MSNRNGVCSSTGVGVIQATIRHALFWDRKAKRDGTERGVVMMHGHDNYAEAWFTDTRDDLAMDVADAGFIGLATLSGSTFGNDTGVGYVEAAYDWLVTAKGPNNVTGAGARTDGVCLLGFSHGATNLLNWARINTSLVTSIALVCPAVDVEDVRANNRSGFQAVIEAAWTNNATWQAARPTRNPVEFASTIASIPIKIWYGGADTITIPSTMTAFAAAHGNTELVNMGAGVTHDVTAVPDGAVSAYLLETA